MQDSISGLAGCTTSREGRDLVWQFLKENWKTLLERFGEKSNFLIYFVEVMQKKKKKKNICFLIFIINYFQYGLSDFADEKLANEIQTFFDSANTPLVTRPVKKVVETINMRSQVLKRDSKAIEEYLSQQQQ